MAKTKEKTGCNSNRRSFENSIKKTEQSNQKNYNTETETREVLMAIVKFPSPGVRLIERLWAEENREEEVYA